MVHSGYCAVYGLGNKRIVICIYLFSLTPSPASKQRHRQEVSGKKKTKQKTKSTDDIVKATRDQGIPHKRQQIKEWPSLY